MNITQQTTTPGHHVRVVHLTLRGLIALCVSMVLATGILMHIVTPRRLWSVFPPRGGSDIPNDTAPTEVPPWGELIKEDVEIEQPEEYVAFEATANRVAAWHFTGMTTTAQVIR